MAGSGLGLGQLARAIRMARAVRPPVFSWGLGVAGSNMATTCQLFFFKIFVDFLPELKKLVGSDMCSL